MNRKIFFILISAVLFISCSDPLTQLPEEKKEFSDKELSAVKGSDKFGIKVFKEVNSQETGKNIFISPLSISIALGMALNGAGSDTYSEMLSAMEIAGLSLNDINYAYSSLSGYLQECDPKVKVNITNSAWYRNDFNIEKSYLDVNREYFKSDIAALDFSDPNSVNIINDWVNKSTSGLITTILDRIPPDAVLYLINAVYFKGIWSYQFDKAKTVSDNFVTADGTTAPCSLMVQENDFQYFVNEQFQAVQLPYGDGRYNMTVILPTNNININNIIQGLNANAWAAWNNNFKEKRGTLLLPKFSLDYELEMNNVLKALGMQKAFTGEADFTGIHKTGGICISSIKHKTFCKVDEEGTEAAAVTSIEFVRTSIGDEAFYMKVNRPFLFVITEKESGAILFIGKIITL